LGVYNLVLKDIIILSLFLSISKNIFSFEVLAKICMEWPPHGSMGSTVPSSVVKDHRGYMAMPSVPLYSHLSIRSL